MINTLIGVVLASSCLASGDVLSMVEARPGWFEPPSDESSKKPGVRVSPSLDIRAGLNLVSSSSIGTRELGNLPFIPGVPLLSNAPYRAETSVSWELGQAISFAAAIDLAPRWRFSVRTGFVYNDLDSLEVQIKATTNITEDVVTLGSLSTAKGRLMQVPVDFVFRYEIGRVDDFSVGVSAGAGFQFSWLEISDARFDDPLLPTPIDFDTDAREMAFRYVGGIDMMWRIAPRTSLGVDAGFAGSSRSNFGDTLAFSIYNVTFGAKLTIDF